MLQLHLSIFKWVKIYTTLWQTKNILEVHINSQNAIISERIKPKLEPITLPERKKIK